MSLRPFKLEIDNTGTNPNNLIVAEPHVLQGAGKRFIVTDNGPFYTASLRLVDRLTGLPLAPRLQYTAIQLEEEATIESGKEVCSIIIIEDDTISPNVEVTYQAYGGWMSWSVTAVVAMIEALDLDGREITWAQIVGRPDRYPPAPHAHPLSDIYGWHKLFPSLNAIREAILASDQAVFDAIRAAFQLEIDRLDGQYETLDASARAHYNNFFNPHNVHVSQTGGYTTTEINALLNQKLGKTETAVNSLKLENRSFAQTRAEIVDSIQNSELDNGLFNKANMGENWASADQSLILTQGGWKKLKVHETAWGRTITEMGGYTITEVNNLLAQKLGKTETAVNSAKLENRTLAQVRSEIVDSIQNSELDNGLFNKGNIGENFVASDPALILTTAGWRKLKLHEASYGQTITELGGYTTTQVNTLLAQKLGKTETAANSLKLENRTFAQTRAEIVNSIQNSELDNGLFNKANIGENFSASDPALIMTTAGWRKLKLHEASYGQNITELGGYTTTQVNNLLAQRLPIGGTAVNSSKLENNTMAQVLAAAYAQVGTMGKRNLHVSTADPTAGAGAVGDVWYKI